MIFLRKIKIAKQISAVLIIAAFIVNSSLLLIPETVRASIVFAQNNINTDLSGLTASTLGVILPNVVAGNLIVVWVKHEGLPTTITVSDGTSSLTPATKTTHSNNDLHGQFFYLLSANSGTRTYTASFLAARTYSEIHAWEYTVSNEIVAFDKEAPNSGTTAGADTITSGNITTTGNTEVAVAGYGPYSSQTLSNRLINSLAADNIIDQTGSNIFGQTWDKAFSAPFTGGASASIGSAVAWLLNLISFHGTNAFTGQTAFRFRNDDGSESAATWLEAENVGITAPASTNTRLRLQASTTSDVASTQYQLEYKKSTDASYRMATTSATESGTLDYTVSAGADDAQQSGTTMTINGTTIGASLDAVSEWDGLRFQSVMIPLGATITNAYISVVPSATTEDEPLVTITFQNIDNALAFTTNASDITARSRTASTTWSSTDLGATGATYHNSPDLSATLQTVINRPGWAVGNSLAVIIEGGATATRDLTVETFENAGSNPPKLHIEYTVPSKIRIVASSNITASGENTTALLSVPGGKSFTAGRMQDDENPADAVDIASDRYSEFEWNLQATSNTQNSDVYTFRLTKNGTAIDSYVVTPQWIIGPSSATSPRVIRLHGVRLHGVRLR